MATINGFEIEEKYSAILDDNLFKNVVLMPGTTYTTRWNESAGAIHITRLGKSSAQVGANGTDFISNDITNLLLTMNRDKNFKSNHKIPNVTVINVPYNLVKENMELDIAIVNEAWQERGVKELGEGATETVGSALTKDTIYDDIVDEIALLKNNNAKPNVILVSPETVALLLKNPQFTRATDLGDRTVVEGVIGRVAGVDVFEYQGFDASGLTGSFIDYIVYDFNTFGIASAVVGSRAIDDPDFIGVRTQIELTAGFIVTNALRATARTTT